MYFEPDGILTLYSGCGVSETEHLVFKSREAQAAFFAAHKKHVLDEMSYMQHDGTLSVELTPEQVNECDYISFVNPTQGDGRTWYGRITDARWVNSATTTEITYYIDWFQTYMFDYEIKTAELEREQLSESDWTKGLDNPFDPSIIELATPENIAVGREFEPMYERLAIGESARTGMSFYPSVSGPAHQFLLMALNLGWLDDANRATWTKTLQDSFDISLGDGMSTPPRISSFPTTLAFIYWNVMGGKWQSVIDYLTLYGLTSEIIGFYNVHEDVINSIKEGGNTWTGVPIELTIFKSTKHPKLSRAPFSYLRVTSPAGVSKDYLYEKFASLRKGEQTFEIRVLNNVLGNPVTYVAPVGYERDMGNDFQNVNEIERIEYADMPQVGMNFDGYLAYLSSQYNSAIMANDQAQQARDQYADSPGYRVARLQQAGLNPLDPQTILKKAGNNLFGLAAGAMLKLSGSDVNLSDWANAGTNAAAQEANIQSLQDAQHAAVMQDAATRNANPSSLSHARRATVADEYRPGGSAGYIPYQIGVGTPTWQITRVGLEENYEDRVVDYLNRFGCTSGRIGKPYVYQYTAGEDGQPHWADVDGAKATFCKCTSVDVICNNLTAAREIERVYMAGGLFIQGDGDNA